MTTYSVVLYRQEDSQVTGFVKCVLTYPEANDCVLAVLETISKGYGAAIVDGGSIEIGDKLTEDMTR